MICNGQSVAGILAAINKIDNGSAWGRRIRYMQPKHILELGTGQGASGAQIMATLPSNSRFTTINYGYPIDYRFGVFLDPWTGDRRLTCIVGDTTNPATLDKVDGGVDLMFIDTTHEAYVACAELRLWQTKLQDGAVVIADDLSHHDMITFWQSLPYDKVEVADQGVFRYDASRPYEANITARTTDDYTQRYLYIDR